MATPRRCFPIRPRSTSDDRLVVGVPEAGLEPFVPRVSLTLPALAQTRQMVFLIEGEAKAEMVARAFGPDAEPDHHVPASLLPPLVSERSGAAGLRARRPSCPAGADGRPVVGVDLGGTKVAAASLVEGRLERLGRSEPRI